MGGIAERVQRFPGVTALTDGVWEARRQGVVERLRIRSPRDFAIVLAAVVVLGAIAARISMLTSESYWTDELWSLDASGMDFKRMFGARLRSEQNPPFYYLALWLWIRVFRSVSEPAARSLSLVAGTIAIVALWRLGPVLISRTAAVTAAVLMSISGISIHYSLEARGYELATMFVALSLAPWIRGLRGVGDVNRNSFLLALFGSLSGFSHYYGNLVYGLEALVYVSFLLARRQIRSTLVFLAWMAASLIPLAIWVVFTWSRLATGGLAPSTLQTLWDSASAMIEPLPTAVDHLGTLVALPAWIEEYRSSTGLLGLSVLLLAAGVLALQGVRGLWRTASARPFEPAIGLLAISIVGIGVYVAYESSQTWKPTLSVRNLTVFLPLIFLAVGCAVYGLRIKGGALRIAAVSVVSGAVLALAMPVWASLHTRGTGPQSPEFEPAARYLIAQGALTEGKNLVGLEPPYDWTGDWLAAASAVDGQAPPLRFPPALRGVHWTMDPTSIPERSQLPSGPVVVFGFDNWAPDRLKVFTDAAAKKYGPCVPVNFKNMGVLRCGG